MIINLMKIIDNAIKNLYESANQGELNKFYQKNYKLISNLIYIYFFIILISALFLFIGLLDSALLLLLKIADIPRYVFYNSSLTELDISNMIIRAYDDSYFVFITKVVTYISSNIKYIVPIFIILSFWGVKIKTKKDSEFDFQGIFLITLSILNMIYEKSTIKILRVSGISIFIFFISRIIIQDNSNSLSISILLISIYLFSVIYRKFDKDISNINKTFILLLISPILLLNTVKVIELSTTGIVATIIASFLIIDRAITLIIELKNKIMNGEDLFFMKNCLDKKYLNKIYRNLDISSLESAENKGKLKACGIVNFYMDKESNLKFATECLSKALEKDNSDIDIKFYLAISYYRVGGEENIKKSICLCEELRERNLTNQFENLILIENLLALGSEDYQYMKKLLKEVVEDITVKSMNYRYSGCKVNILSNSSTASYEKLIKDIQKLKKINGYEDIYYYETMLELLQENVNIQKVKKLIDECEVRGFDTSIFREELLKLKKEKEYIMK